MAVAVYGACSSAWLNIHQALSQSSLIDPALSDTFLALLKWRLALPLSPDNLPPPPCPGCGAQQDFFGDHALSCASMGRYARHNRIRDLFEGLFNEAGFATQIEAEVPATSLRPADILVDGFSGDFPTAFDVTVSHALRPSISLAGVECGFGGFGGRIQNSLIHPSLRCMPLAFLPAGNGNKRLRDQRGEFAGCQALSPSESRW